MAGIDKKLTDLTELTTPSDGSFIHVVEPLDISQSPDGSSYKVKKSNFGGISDAPSNGTTYGRKDAAWVAVSSTDTTADHFRGNWNASTNTPALTNGVGQVGDYYVVNVAGTQFSISFGIGDIIAYNGTSWYMFANNNQSPVITTNTNITSSVLTTQNVAGFVAYINGLVSSFSVAVNEIRTYTVTDTGQIFELLLRGRSFGGSEPDITTSDVLIISEKFHEVWCAYNQWNPIALNTWRTWDRNTSQIMVTDANKSLGTGASLTLANFIDCNGIYVKNVSSLKNLSFYYKFPGASVQTFEILIAAAQINTGSTPNGTELNYTIIIQQQFTSGTASSSFLKDDFTINSHTLGSNNIIFISFRQITGTVSAIQGPQLRFRFQ